MLCRTRAERRYMVDFNESEGESAFLVVRSTKGVWFDNPHVLPPSLGAEVRTFTPGSALSLR